MDRRIQLFALGWALMAIGALLTAVSKNAGLWILCIGGAIQGIITFLELRDFRKQQRTVTEFPGF